MKRIVTLTAIIALIISGCSKKPYAEFRYTPANPVVGEQIFFQNYSLDFEYVEWDFDDGTITSEYEPIHTYTSGGLKTVELRAIGKKGDVDIALASITVTDVDPQAGFGIYTDLPLNGEVTPVETDIVYTGEQIEFFNTSTDAVEYEWTFGDGVSSDIESPSYSYDTKGIYTVRLKAYNSSGTVSTMTKTLEVVRGLNSTVRITVLDIDEDYLPVEGASVILYRTLNDWDDFFDPIPDEDGLFTSELGKCVFEGLNAQRYYVDAWAGDNYNNWALRDEDVAWIETQILDPDYIHDFFAYIVWTGDGKKTVKLERVGMKERTTVTESAKKKLGTVPKDRVTKFSKARKL